MYSVLKILGLSSSLGWCNYRFVWKFNSYSQILLLTNAQPKIPTAIDSDSTRANIGHDGIIISNADTLKCDSLFNITKAKPGDFRNFRNGISCEYISKYKNKNAISLQEDIGTNIRTVHKLLFPSLMQISRNVLGPLSDGFVYFRK